MDCEGLPSLSPSKLACKVRSPSIWLERRTGLEESAEGQKLNENESLGPE